MKNYFIIGLIIGAAVSGAMAVQAINESTTIQSCSSLLPSGHSFRISINGDIDTKSKVPSVTGEISLTESTIKNGSKIESQIQPFVECVNNLVK